MMKVKLKIGVIKLLFLTFFSMLTVEVLAHGDEDHNKKTGEIVAEDTDQGHQQATGRAGKIKADFSDFPTLHPLVVHFPVVLLPLALLSQLIGLFVFRKELSWVTLALAIGGLISAYLAQSVFHPHTTGLYEHAERILEQHEQYAEYTLWFSGIAVLLKVGSHFFLKRKWWSELILAVLLAAATYTVSTAGHYGAQMIHIEGIGAKGKYIETHAEEHDH